MQGNLLHKCQKLAARPFFVQVTEKVKGLDPNIT